ncbi:hypothetical protein J7U46_20895 [Pelomonas sp. V22]|uniref:hypothetical protein n=1 Tax=Pelomonas sp. V22 TaxID=2822139 RepID=UPI0024A9C902|nr:hypothetical protein [Pelomonas sp. V22]MDI4635534.1 hypothetical protein [Pelomonas sp. V22]
MLLSSGNDLQVIPMHQLDIFGASPSDDIQVGGKGDEYYVYRHRFADGALYIGKGLGGRYCDFKRRSVTYLRKVHEFGLPEVEILESGLSEEQAFLREAREISEARRSRNELLNATDGLEKASVGTMPWRTLLHANLSNQQLPIPYQRLICLAQISPPNRWIVDASIMEAALVLKCSMNEVLDFVARPAGGVMNNFRFVTKSKLLEERPDLERHFVSKKFALPQAQSRLSPRLDDADFFGYPDANFESPSAEEPQSDVIEAALPFGRPVNGDEPPF